VGQSQRTQSYYVPREAGPQAGDYWSKAVDPDGVERVRVSEAERLSYLENVKDELAFIKALKPGTHADFGSGPGWLIREMPNWDSLAIEISEDAQAELTHRHIPWQTTWPRESSQQVDLITCLHVIEHLPCPLRAVAKFHSVLKPGGHLIISTPDFGSPCARRFGDNFRGYHDPTHVSLFTQESLARLLRDFGFTIKDIQFPFPDKYATPETFARWHDTTKVSPPWPGNWVTFYCTRGGE